MSKMDELRRTVGSNVDESMGGGRSERASIPGVSVASPPAKSPRLQGVGRSSDAAEIEVDRIVPDPDQPRSAFDPEGITRLADSMARFSQISPILVRWDGASGKYIIVAGERRWRAAMSAGIPRIKCVIREGDSDPGELLAIQVVENACREDLRPVEQAKAFRSLMDSHGWSQHRLANELGIAQPSVVRALAMLDLPSDVREMVEQGDLSRSTAYEISKAGDDESQIEIASRVVAEKLSRDQTVEVVRQAKASKTSGISKGRGARGKPKPITSRAFKTSVGVKITAERNKGLDPAAILAAAREVVAQLESEMEGDRAA